MNLRHAKTIDNNISINITHSSEHDNSFELPDNPAYATLMLIGLGIVASCACYCCTAKLVLGENLFLESIKEHINLVRTIGKDTTTIPAEEVL